MDCIDRTEKFWDSIYSEKETDYSLDRIIELSSFVNCFLDRVSGKKVLDIGCGRGYLSLLMAHYGACVTAIDISENACIETKRLIKQNEAIIKKGKVEVIQMNAIDLDELGNEKYDFVFGRFILHHIEPFGIFAKKLDYVTKKGGVLCFYENSANNPLLMFCRKFLVGRFGIPRYGDGVEIPLSKEEVNVLRKHFQVEITIPKLYFFQMLDKYIFKKKGSFLAELDDWCFRRIPYTHKWSYHQVLKMSKSEK